VLTEVDWRNPHIEVDIDVKGDAGRTESWTVEGMPPNWFRTRKIDRADFERATGQTVTVFGNRARDGTHSVLMEKITLQEAPRWKCPV
jgi:hypothetical protein